MGLNMIRLEGKMPNEAFFELADSYGIMIAPGWYHSPCRFVCWISWELWQVLLRCLAALVCVGSRAVHGRSRFAALASVAFANSSLGARILVCQFRGMRLAV